MPETTYIVPPIARDPADLAADAYALIQTYYPDWEPQPAGLDTITIEAVANMIADLRETASDVPAEIFAFLGSTILGVPRIDAVEAIATTTWTMVDDAGYTVEAGELVGIPVSGSEVEPFEVAVDFTVAPGSTQATGVELRALNEGVAPNDADGTPYPLGSLAFVESIALTAGPSGGVDEETVDAYLNRLTEHFSIVTARPVVARDFAVLARTRPEVYRATAFDNYAPGANEIQSVEFTGSPVPSSGTFKLNTASPNPSAAIPWNATADQVKAALEQGEIDPPAVPGNIIVTGGPLPASPVYVEFAGQYAETNVALMTVSDRTGGVTPPQPTISTTQVSTAPTVVEKTVTVSVADEDGEPVAQSVLDDVSDYLEDMREANFVVNVVNPAYSVIDVTYTAVAHPSYDEASVLADADAAIAAYLDPGTWGSPNYGDPGTPGLTEWTNQDTVRYGEIYAVLNAVVGLDYVETLELAVSGGAQSEADVVMAGLAPLPRPGVISGSVSAAA